MAKEINKRSKCLWFVHAFSDKETEEGSVEESSKAAFAIASELVPLDGDEHLLGEQVVHSLGSQLPNPAPLTTQLLGRRRHQLPLDGPVTLGDLWRGVIAMRGRRLRDV